jgi:hypothetical protein
MKKIPLTVFITFVGLLFHLNIQAQQLDSLMSVYDEYFPREKVHIHFDRTIYNKEETIFYKAYLQMGNMPSDLSKNMYVAWFDTSGNLLKQTAAPLFQSTAKGSFDIPANYKGDFIHVKAFTRWMLNDDSAYVFERNILINSGKSIGSVAKTVFKSRVDLFPESGNLVQGVNNRIAFKATNQFGTPVLIKGFLVNDKNKILDTLKALHDGMGMFNLKPIIGEKYQLNWTDEFGQKGSTVLPLIKTQGVVLKVSTDYEKAYAQIERTNEVPVDFKKFKLLVHQHQQLIYTVDFKGEEKLVQKAALPIDELPTGIVQFSLFTEDWKPVAERIVFVNNRLHEFNAKMSIPIIDLKKRGKNIIEIMVSDTASTNMSLSVTDASIVVPEQQTIYSDLLLSSDIKGKVHNPAYYFSSDADSVAAHLDLVMMTNGWRRFDWEKLVKAEYPKQLYSKESDFLKLSGKVYGNQALANSKDLQLNLVIAGKDSSSKLLFLPVAKDGSFEQTGVMFYDTVRVFYSFNNNPKLTEQTQVKIQNGLLYQEFKKIAFSLSGSQAGWSDSMARVQLNFYLSEQEKLRRQMESATLQEVIVKAKTKSPIQQLEEKYASGLFSGGDGYSFDLSTDLSSMGAIDVLTYLQGKVAGLTITGSGANAQVSWRGATPDLFLNEMKMSIDMVQSLNVPDIAFIKVFRPPFFGSPGGGGGGAIAIYTKKGKSGRGNQANNKGMENTILGGYSVFKEFFNPNYDKPTGNFEVDSRTTLFWNPYLLTNKRSPRVKVEFYNNDSSKKLQVVLEGVNSNGKLTRVVKIIE